MSASNANSASSLDWFRLLSSLLGGVSLLNYSLSKVSGALKAAFGDGLRESIKRATRTRLIGFVTGCLATALLSSATASSMLVLAFVQAGDMSLQESLGIGLGIGLGSSLNAHLLAYSLTRYSYLMIALGYIGCSFGSQRAPLVARVCEAIFGLGLMFLSTSIVSKAMAPLKGYEPFIYYLSHLQNPALAMLVSGLAAVAFQSSNTVIAISLSLAKQGFLTSETGIYFVLGANVGTALTPVIAALGKRREALRVALAYLLLKLVGLATLLPVLARFVAVVQWSTFEAQSEAEDAAYESLVDSGKAGQVAGDQLEAAAQKAVLPAQIANAHSIFNAWAAVVCMPFLSYLSDCVLWAMPDGAKDGLSKSGSAVLLSAGAPGAVRYNVKRREHPHSDQDLSDPAWRGQAGDARGSGGAAAMHLVGIAGSDGEGTSSPGDLSARSAGKDDDGVTAAAGADPSRRLFARRR